jgi:morphogenetic protein associated with SpoVID
MASLTIKKGDTLSDIAKSKGLSLRALLGANPQIKNANKIRIGQKINLPEGKVAGGKSSNPYKRMSKTQMSMLNHKNKNEGAQEGVTRSVKQSIKQGAESRSKDAAKPKGSSDPRGEKAAMEEKKKRAKLAYQQKKKSMLSGRNKSRSK